MLLTVAVGCAAKPSARVTVNPSQSRQAYQQVFPQAVFSKSPQGQYDIILAQEGTENAPQSRPGKPLQAMDHPPLQQVIHIHVLWKSRLSRADHPSATNAVVNWYVIGAPGSGGPAVLHYKGAAFVSFNDAGQTLKATVRDGSLELTARYGSITDPLGASTLSGSILAQRNAAQVQAWLSRLNDLLAASPSPQTLPAEPPARRPNGP